MTAAGELVIWRASLFRQGQAASFRRCVTTYIFEHLRIVACQPNIVADIGKLSLRSSDRDAKE